MVQGYKAKMQSRGTLLATYLDCKSGGAIWTIVSGDVADLLPKLV